MVPGSMAPLSTDNETPFRPSVPSHSEVVTYSTENRRENTHPQEVPTQSSHEFINFGIQSFGQPHSSTSTSSFVPANFGVQAASEATPVPNGPTGTATTHSLPSELPERPWMSHDLSEMPLGMSDYSSAAEQMDVMDSANPSSGYGTITSTGAPIYTFQGYNPSH